ncbi:Disease resistance protein, partial [Nymphaea thermarum]
FGRSKKVTVYIRWYSFPAFSLFILFYVGRSNKKEVELIQEIVERVGGCNDNVMLPVAEHPVGIDSRVEEVMELLSIGEGDVKMVGIYGMGGVGKTTLAKEIYNRLQGTFEKAIYIERIKDRAKKKDGLPKLQEEFLCKVFKDGNKKIRNLSEGSAEIRRRFPGKRVLVVLDDVDHGDQLQALAGGGDWFGEGTKILITTRDVQLLDAHPVHKKYQVHELNSSESLHLFSRHAFKTDQPSKEFMEISKKIAKAAGGLPLALEILGASLSTETEKEAWEEVKTKLRSSGYSKIDKCLRTSYAGLNKNEKEGFLDIACFFLGQKKDEVIDIWKGCHFDAPVLTVNSLFHKCLLKVDDFIGRLHMHDLLRDMGRVIGSRSRLWNQKEVWDVLEEHKGTNKIKGIICKKYMEGEGKSFNAIHSLVPNEQERESVDVEAFTNMSNLQFLLLENINLKGDFSRMPRSLRSLKWTGCSMQTLPDNFNIQKLGCLKLDSRKIVQFWSDNCISKEKVFTNLKVLDLSECGKLKKLPDFSHSLNLEKLRLTGCCSLTDIPKSIGNSTKLKMIDLIRCYALQSLPSSIGRLTKLEHLVLHSCFSLSRLPNSIENLTGLRKLEVSYCQSLLALPNSIKNFTRLEELSLTSWASFSTLPHFIENLTKLRSLDVSHCDCLSALPSSIGNLTRLKRLMLNSCKSLSALPNSIENLTGLEELELANCESLSTLPDSIGNLTGLSKLDLLGCDSLLALPNSIGSLTRLEELSVSSARLSTLPPCIGNLMKLGSLDVYNCERLLALPNSIGSLTELQELLLTKCRSLSMLSDSIKNLTWLKSLHLSHCTSLKALPDSIGNLTRLEYLGLGWCISLSTLPDSIMDLNGVKELYAAGCTSLLALPDAIGNLTGLEKLSLASCRRLSTLPSSIGSMRRLSTLVLNGSGIEELPDSVRLLESLEWLGIANCRLRSRLPLWEMKCLKGLVIGGEDIDSDDEDENEICEISDDISDNDDGGRIEVCEIPDGIARIGGEVNQKDESDSDDEDENEICEISDGISDNDDGGRMKVCKIPDGIARVGGEVNQKDESDIDDEDQNEACVIPYGITHYSHHMQECRRIRYINAWDNPPHGLPGKVCELSIWVVRSRGRERKIILLVYPLTEWSWECPCGREYWNGPWLKHIFPDDFTPLHDKKALEACASSSSAPVISEEQMGLIIGLQALVRKETFLPCFASTGHSSTRHGVDQVKCGGYTGGQITEI